jgi:hypothetical protein
MHIVVAIKISSTAVATTQHHVVLAMYHTVNVTPAARYTEIAVLVAATAAALTQLYTCVPNFT